MRLPHFLLFLLLLAGTASSVLRAQTYAFPVPKSKGLSGTYGELRGSHFHFGLDVRVFSRWGEPIYAAADGHVSRVRIWYNGYGRALYIRHANGYSTVYAHLERFAPKIEKELRRQQTAKRQFNHEFYPRAGEMPIKKGELIGYSGSTGGSSGPHLHYEIRTPAEVPINPMPYHLDHIDDPTPPFITRLAVEPLSAASRVNGVFAKDIQYPKKVRTGVYTAPKTVEVSGPVGFEFTAYDKSEGSWGYNGIYRAEVRLDGELIYSFRMDRMTFDESHYIYQHIDYGFKRQEGGYLQRAYIEDGNRAPIYGPAKNRGVIDLKDEGLHKIELKTWDAHGNESLLTARLKHVPRNDVVKYAGRVVQDVKAEYWMNRNVVVARGALPADETRQALVRFRDGSQTTLPPAYTRGNRCYTLVPFDGRRVPESLTLPDGRKLKLDTRTALYPDRDQSFQPNEYVNAWFPAAAIFDTMLLEFKAEEPSYKNACSPVYHIGSIEQPMFAAGALRIKPDRNQDKFRPEQMQVIEIKPNGKFNRFSTNNRGATRFKRPGRYCLIGDNTPPTLRPKNFRDGGTLPKDAYKLVFQANDDAAEINPWKIEAYLDGEWIAAEYYEYTRLLIYQFADHPIPPGRHQLKIALTDNAGNTSVHEYSFTR